VGESELSNTRLRRWLSKHWLPKLVGTHARTFTAFDPSLLRHEDVCPVAMTMLVGLTCHAPTDTYPSISLLSTAVAQRTSRASLTLA
jgi:hypothetical protein